MPTININIRNRNNNSNSNSNSSSNSNNNSNSNTGTKVIVSSSVSSSSANNSVETTERCSTDGTTSDPTMPMNMNHNNNRNGGVSPPPTSTSTSTSTMIPTPITTTTTTSTTIMNHHHHPSVPITAPTTTTTTATLTNSMTSTKHRPPLAKNNTTTTTTNKPTISSSSSSGGGGGVSGGGNRSLGTNNNNNNNSSGSGGGSIGSGSGSSGIPNTTTTATTTISNNKGIPTTTMNLPSRSSNGSSSKSNSPITTTSSPITTTTTTTTTPPTVETTFTTKPPRSTLSLPPTNATTAAATSLRTTLSESSVTTNNHPTTGTNHNNNNNNSSSSRGSSNYVELQQEQILFQQRIMDDTLGLAIRKINQYGKSNLRYVKCLTMNSSNSNSNSSSTKQQRTINTTMSDHPESGGGGGPRFDSNNNNTNHHHHHITHGSQSSNRSSSSNNTSTSTGMMSHNSSSHTGSWNVRRTNSTSGANGGVRSSHSAVTVTGNIIGGGGGINSSSNNNISHRDTMMIASSSATIGEVPNATTVIHNNRNNNNNTYQVLSWGKKKDVQIPLRLFIAVRKGKTTDRAKRCTTVPANRIVSMITCDPYHPSLDIEAPTMMDRNKFARAFAHFLHVPLFEEDSTTSTSTTTGSAGIQHHHPLLPRPPPSVSSSLNQQQQQQEQQQFVPITTKLVGNETNRVVPFIRPNNIIVSSSNRTLPPEHSQNNNTNSTILNGQQNVVSVPETINTSEVTTATTNNAHIITDQYSDVPQQEQQQHEPMEVFGSSPFIQLTTSSQPNSDYGTASATDNNNNKNINSTHAVGTTSTKGSNNDHTGSNNSNHNAFETGTAMNFFQSDNFNQRPIGDLDIIMTRGDGVERTMESMPAAATTTTRGAIVSVIPDIDNDIDKDDRTHMSSLTGHGYDQELVEELHNALNELRGELEESRAEASRAVKVAEQAIQSAERSNSMEWQNTVTHKAAEAAALAQKRSAAAMAKQRVAEERLEGERRAASFWRKQAEIAEEEAGTLQTRAAAAEVQRAALEELLDHERRITSEQITVLRGRFTSTDVSQRDALEAALERNRALELELDGTRRDLQSKQNEIMLVAENQNDDDNKNKKLKRNFGRKKKGSGDVNDSTSLLSDHVFSSSSALLSLDETESRVPSNNNNNHHHHFRSDGGGLSTEQVLRVHAETQLMRQQFEMLKRATADHLEQLPDNIRVWGQQISQSLQNSQAEVARLQAKFAMESASRRKLLHEVQDLRGAIRVYCRPMPSMHYDELITLPSHDSILFHRDRYDDELGPVSFEFDRVFDANNSKQQDVYAEVQDVCLGVLDGYNICVMAYGPSDCGKTSTIFGDIDVTTCDTIRTENYGIHLQAMNQLFTIAQHRSERYKDIFSLTIIEVHNERIRDLISATETGNRCGHVMIAETKNSMAGGATANRKLKSSTQDNDDASSGRPSKLEIRTDIHGDTVIQGLVTVEVNSMQDVLSLWQECIAVKNRRLEEQGVDIHKYDAANHVIATLRVKSSNIATGIGTIGKIQFVDLAAADVVPRNQSLTTQQTQDTISDVDASAATTTTATLMNQNDWRFANRSLETFGECIEARMQFDRNVPYRNSTLTHLLRDSLEADTKVLMLACVSSDPTNIHETIAVLKFASQLRRVIIGKATKHILST